MAHGEFHLDTDNVIPLHDQRILHQKKVIGDLLGQVPPHMHVSFLHRLRQDMLNRIDQERRNTPEDQTAQSASIHAFNDQVANRVLQDQASPHNQRRKARQKNTLILFMLSAASIMAVLTFFTHDTGHPFRDMPGESYVLMGIGTLGFIVTLGLTFTETRLREKEREAIKAELHRANPESPHIVIAAIDALLASQFQ